MAGGRKKKSGVSIKFKTPTYVRNKQAGTVLPKADRVLDKNVDKVVKDKTMYAPTQNMKSNSIGKMLQNVGPFGTRWAGKLKYCELHGQLTGGLGIYYEVLFNLNSLFDPDRTGAGHQPLGFDQLSVMYGRYRVIKTSWRITPMTDIIGTNTGIVAYVSNSIVSAGSIASAIEAGYSKLQFSNGYTKFSPLKASTVLYALTGQDLESYRANDRYDAFTTASPSELLILHVGVESTRGTPSEIEYYLEMEFDCEFYDPAVIPPS
jgi:hypothetical protein